MLRINSAFPVRKEYKKSIFLGCGPPVAPAEYTVRCSAVSGCLVRCLPGHALPDGSTHTTLLCSAGQSPFRQTQLRAEAESKEKHGIWDPLTVLTADYNLTLCPLLSRILHIYHGQPYARVDLNPMPEATLTLRQSRP
jgi:hypothetical protein